MKKKEEKDRKKNRENYIPENTAKSTKKIPKHCKNAWETVN